MNSAAHSDLMPTVRSRGEVYCVAHELRELAVLAIELSSDVSGRKDVPRAEATLRKAAALLGARA